MKTDNLKEYQRTFPQYECKNKIVYPITNKIYTKTKENTLLLLKVGQN